MMPQVASELATISIESVYKDQIEYNLQEAISTIPYEHRRRMSELAFVAYDAIRSGQFKGAKFSIAITASDDEFVIGVKKEV
jgi:hypothetical protein